MIARLLPALAQDRRGASLPEFAIVLTPLLVLLMGAVDIGYQAYVRVVTLGALETAARRVLLEGANEAGIEADTKAQIKRVMSTADVVVETGTFYRFNDIEAMERITLDLNGNGQLDGPVDTDGNGVPDKSDCWEDVDNNGQRNLVTVGRDGIGGADDIVKSTATVTYTRLLPIWRLIGIGSSATVVASTLVRRQPYENQSPPTIRCMS